jgi:hypothetical protein
MNDAELADAIAQRRFGALTLDTSVFDQFGCSLDSKALQAVGPVCEQHGIRLVFSEVTAGEVQAHIHKAAADQSEKLRAALNQYRKAWRRAETVAELAPPVDLEAEADLLARKEWEAFFNDVHADVIVSESLVSAGELVRRYFAMEPPFGAKDGKKHEFPDAIALLALEAWAEQGELTVLVISRDADWQGFCAAAKHLVCASNFQQTLGHFNRAAQAIADRAIELLKAAEAPELHHEIGVEIEAWLDQADFTIDASSEFYFDAEPEGAVLQSWEIVSGPEVLAIEGEEVTFSIVLDCVISFTANFDLSVRDGIDRDYVSLNSQTEEAEENYRVTLTITVGRTIAPEPTVVSVQANRRRLHVDFGHVSLDWGYEE